MLDDDENYEVEIDEQKTMLSIENFDLTTENDSDSELIFETEPTKSRKRKRCPEMWKRNVEKRAKYDL